MLTQTNNKRKTAFFESNFAQQNNMKKSSSKFLRCKTDTKGSNDRMKTTRKTLRKSKLQESKLIKQNDIAIEALMVGSMGNMKQQRDMIKKQIENVDGVIDKQTSKEVQLFIIKNDQLLKDYNKMCYRRLLLEKEFSRLLVSGLLLSTF